MVRPNLKFLFTNNRLLTVRRGNEEDGGQVLVIGLVTALGLALISLSIANVGIMVAEKMRAQDTADAAAYSAAVVEARYMNLTAYLNRAMIANYDQMAFDTALWASVVSLDHGIAPMLTLMYLVGFIVDKIPIVQAAGPVIDKITEVLDKTVHAGLHSAGQGLGKAFGQDDDHFEQSDMNKILETYITDVLSTYQGILYAATQAARYRVIEEVAEKMDKELVTTTLLGLGAETVSSDELQHAVDWVIDEPDKRLSGMDTINNAFNRVMEEDKEIHDSPSGDDYDREPTVSDDDKLVMLGAMTEASLDKFTAGRTRTGTRNALRQFQFDDLIPEPFKVIFIPAMVADCIADCITFWDGCSCNFDMHMIPGSRVKDYHEDCYAQGRAPVIARQRIREVNFFGMDMDLNFFQSLINAIMSAVDDDYAIGAGKMGYTSGQNKTDIENIDNMIEPNDFDADRFMQAILGGSQDNMLNIMMSGLTLCQIAAATSTNDRIDDHWDGSFDAKPTCAVLRATGGTPCYDETADYVEAVGDAGDLPNGVPKYDLRTDMNLVGWTQYHYDETDAPERPDGSSGGDENNLLAGPSVAAITMKPVDKINGLRGLGLSNPYPITAISRGQVYYVRNPNRPDERPNLMNPHWVARLAPLDSPDTPKLLSDGLPHLMTLGAPMKPTH